MEGDSSQLYTIPASETFQSTPSVWRETNAYLDASNNLVLFQSTPSVWRETEQTLTNASGYQISIHSLRVEGDFLSAGLPFLSQISIHSLRVEGDNAKNRHYRPSYTISIHSLRVEGDGKRSHP